MSRSEARTSDAWRSFDRWAWLLPLVFAVPAAIGWSKGVGKDPSCCSKAAAPVVAAPAPVVAPTVTPPTELAPTVPAPVAAAPTIDCASITAGAAIGFAVNSVTLTDAGRRALDEVLVCLKDGAYEVVGHTDSAGEPALNQALSVARAQSAVRYLIGKGVAAERLSASGLGETTPIADNATPEGRARNRRLAFQPR